MRLDNKGFTLVEVLAVVVILGVLAMITIPSVSHIINQNKEDNYKSLEKSIINAAKLYVSDNRYKVTLDGSCESNSTRNVVTIDGNSINNNISLKLLFDEGYLSSDNIVNPLDNSKHADLEDSYVKVIFECKSRDYSYSPFNSGSYLKWV